MEPAVARRLWTLLEPLHALVYFAPEAGAAYAAAGLKGGWMGYFASRSAALGPVSAEVVIATFYGFSPWLVRRAIPDAWHRASPERVLEARWLVADAALRRVLGEEVDGQAASEAASVVVRAFDDLDLAGRPLFAAHAALRPPDGSHLALWWGATCLREHRGDGHVAALLSEGVDGCQAHLLVAVGRGLDADTLRDARGWSAAAWAEAAEALRERGLLNADGRLSARGAALRTHIEGRTDLAALPPYRHLGPEQTARLEAALEPLTRCVVAAGAFPYPNPIGLPAP